MPVSGFIRVIFPTDRRVFVNSREMGRTNEVLEVGPGPFRIDLGHPATYTPSFRRVMHPGTHDAPTEVEFTMAGVVATSASRTR